MAISRHFDKIFNFLEKIYDGNFMVVNAKIFKKKIFPSVVDVIKIFLEEIWKI